jgi:hypothetical protein
MLMIGVTLSLGGIISIAALGQFGLATDQASLGSSLEQRSAGTQLSLVYASVTPASSCPSYRGEEEGTNLTVAVFDYGTVGSTPVEIMVNSTAHSGAYATVPSGGLAAYSVTLGTCAHGPGQSILLVDSVGDEVQLGT